MLALLTKNQLIEVDMTTQKKTWKKLTNFT